MTTNRQQELCPETKQLMEYMVRYHQALLKKIFKEHKKPLTMYVNCAIIEYHKPLKRR